MTHQEKKKIFDKFKNLTYYNDVNRVCRDSDLVILHTEWDEFKSIDFKKLVKNKNFKVYDLRNLYNQDEMIEKN